MRKYSCSGPTVVAVSYTHLVKSVSELLGHADVRTTLRLYVHSSMDYKRRAVEGIGFLKGIT